MIWRNRFRLQMKQILLLVIFLFFILPVHGESTATPPDPYAILHQYYEAIGGLDRLKTITTVYTEGSTEYDGLKGTFRSWEKKPLQYRLEEDFAILQQIQGDDGQVSWKKDPNGKVVILRDEQTLKRRKIALEMEHFDHLNPKSSLFTISYEGFQPVNEHLCHAIKIRNRLNEDVMWYFIDRESFLLVKSVSRLPDIEIHTLYSDYRNEDGLLFPFYDESRIFPRQKKEINRIEKQIINAPIDPALFPVPPDSSRDYEFTEGNRSENIPFQLVENLIYLEVKTGNHTRMWLLDSGASMSVIDQKFALEMGIRPEGRIRGYGFGANFDLEFIRLPGFSLPGVTFGKQTIFSFQGLAEKTNEPTCYGILGYDFLSRFVVKIDYTARRLSLYDPADFIYTGKGTVIDAPLKNGIFTLPMMVDGIYSGKWSLDIGSFNTSFHFPFAKANNLFQKKGVSHISRGLGGEYMEKTIRFDHLRIGNYILQNPLISIPDDQGTGATSSAEYIGTIGNSVLRHFTLYMDYENQKVICEPGDDFHTIFPQDNSGIQVGRTGHGNPYIVFISPGSPGEKAGFREGDVIEKINHLKFDHHSSLISIKNLLRQKKGTALQFQIIRDDREKSIRLILDNMYQN
ncbi:MAG: aspartyl protease family protein [Pseudomonadota bacterium]